MVHLRVIGKVTVHEVLYGAGKVNTVRGASLYNDGSAVHVERDNAYISTTWWPRNGWFKSKAAAARALRRYLETEVAKQATRLEYLRTRLAATQREARP